MGRPGGLGVLEKETWGHSHGGRGLGHETDLQDALGGCVRKQSPRQLWGTGSARQHHQTKIKIQGGNRRGDNRGKGREKIVDPGLPLGYELPLSQKGSRRGEGVSKEGKATEEEKPSIYCKRHKRPQKTSPPGGGGW